MPIPTPPHDRNHVWVGVGDIGWCGSSGVRDTAQRIADELSLAAKAGLPATPFILGDNAYRKGSQDEYERCYRPDYGRFDSIIYPTPGNHEYETPGAAGYFGYFGSRAGPPGLGHYSYNLGDWHIVSLNSERVDTEQSRWLLEDLALHKNFRCTAAYWHRPLTSSGVNGDNRHMEGIWAILAENGVDLVVNGHDHLYERFLPRNALLQIDRERGMRQFTVGTGGALLTPRILTKPGSEFAIEGHYGIISFVLGNHAYSWQFISSTGLVLDSNVDLCH